MEFPIFAYLALLLLAALFSTRLMKVLRLPNVTGFIITGILMGPFVFGLLFNNFTYDGIKTSTIATYISRLSWVSSAALGFIAFSIGTSFKTSILKAVGKRVIIITICESLGASILVILALTVAHFIFPDTVGWEFVLTLGAIAAATAPAATLMVIRQYRARGPLVDTLLPVVALDDASALILFAILFQIAQTISGGGEFSLYRMLGKPVLEIVMSLSFGAIIGGVISLCNKVFHSRNNRLVLCIFSVFASLGLYYLFVQPQLGGFELSSLLMCMMAGALYSNLRKDSGPTFDVLDRFTSPIYMMFFVLSGASLDLTIFASGSGLVVLAIALAYLLSRALGKWAGAFSGACFTRSPSNIKKYLGFTLIPQAGVAIGLATTASSILAQNPGTAASGGMILAIVLTSTLVYELVGPMICKFALQKAGEIPAESAT